MRDIKKIQTKILEMKKKLQGLRWENIRPDEINSRLDAA